MGTQNYVLKVQNIYNSHRSTINLNNNMAFLKLLRHKTVQIVLMHAKIKPYFESPEMRFLWVKCFIFLSLCIEIFIFHN